MRQLLLIPFFIIGIQVCTAQTATEFYDKGVIEKNDRKIKEALASFREATRLKPDYTAAWYEMGWCQNDTKDYIGAIISLRKARIGWADVPKVHFELGYAFEKTEKSDSAVLEYKRCLELKPDYSLAFKQLGTIAYYKEEYDKMLEHFAKYEEYTKNPVNDYLYWYRKGFACNALKKYSDAKTSLHKSSAIKTDYANTYLELGFASSRLKENDEAINFYKKAIELDPKSHIPYNGIGEVYRDNIKDRTEAMSWYQKALALKKNERKACFGIGYCLNSLGKYDEALDYLQKAIEQEDDYVAAYVELGYSYYKLNKLSLALENFDKAIELNPSNENSRYYSCLVYIAQKNKSMAQKMIDKLKELGSKNANELQDKVNKM